MPRYFFSVRKDSHAPDTVSVDLADLATAQGEAASIMGQEMKDHPNAIWTDEEWYVEVADERGLILFTLYCAAIRAAAAGLRPFTL